MINSCLFLELELIGHPGASANWYYLNNHWVPSASISFLLLLWGADLATTRVVDVPKSTSSSPHVSCCVCHNLEVILRQNVQALTNEFFLRSQFQNGVFYKQFSWGQFTFSPEERSPPAGPLQLTLTEKRLNMCTNVSSIVPSLIHILSMWI